MASTSVGLAASGQHDVILSPQLIVRDTVRGFVGLTATSSVLDAFSGICKLCSESSSGEISLSELSLPLIPYVCACYDVCFLLSSFHVADMLMNGGSTVGACIAATLWSIPLERHVYLLVMVCGQCQECSVWLRLPLLQVGGASSYSFSCPQLFHLYGGVQIWGPVRGTPDPFTFPTWKGWVVFSKSHLMTWSTLNPWWVLNLMILVW